MLRLRSLVAIPLFLALATPALAVDTSPIPRGQLRQEIREDRQELKSDVAHLHADQLQRRFGFYYRRFENIIHRLESRINTLKGKGKDTSSATAKLTTAQNDLAAAKAKGDEAIAAFRAIDPAKFPEQRTAAFAARDLATQARKLFQTVTADLKAVTAELKKL